MSHNDFTFVVFDIETTGLDPHQGSIIEIGALKYEGARFLGEFHAMLRPRVKIEPQAFLAHGISDEVALRDGREPAEVLQDFLAFAAGAVLVAHNGIGFDFPFLAAECARWGLSLGANPLLDTLPLARRYLKTPGGSYRLQALCEAYQVVNEQAHRALSDARATTKIFQVILRTSSILEELWECCFGLQIQSIVEIPAGFELLQKAIDGGKDIYIEYESQGKPRRERWVRPRNLTVGVNGARCVKAICLEDNIEKHFRLDRIHRLIQIKE